MRKHRQIQVAEKLADLRVPPGNRLERLKGNRIGRHSIRTNDQYRLAKEIQVPAERIGAIIARRRSITADTDLRLCRFFVLSNGYWLRVRGGERLQCGCYAELGIVGYSSDSLIDQSAICLLIILPPVLCNPGLQGALCHSGQTRFG